MESKYLTIKDAWGYFTSNIWLFVILMSVSLSVALGYVIVTPPIYQREASILIKSDEQRQAVNSVLLFDGNGGMQSSNIDINNEVNILLMPKLMQSVVERLSLQDSYSVKFKNLRWVDIYHYAPFKINVDTMLESCSIDMDVEIVGDNDFNIANISINNNIVEDLGNRQYGDTISTPYGAFTVEKAEWVKDRSSQNLYKYSRRSIASASARYSRLLSVESRSKDASIIDLSMTGGSIRKIEDILNTLISIYNENWIKDKNLITISTTNFINERLKIIEQELGVVDENISSYKSENLLPDVKAVSSMNLQSSNEILKKQIALNNQLSMAQYILHHLQNSNTESQLLPVNTGIEEAAVEGQIARYNELLLRKNTLLASSSIKNPIIADMIKELDRQKDAIEASVNGFINTLNRQIENSRREEIVARNRLSENPSQELYLLSTGREQMVKEQLYLFLLQKREENELNQAFTAYNTKVLSYANGSNVPIEPKRDFIFLIGLVIGVILPIVILIIRESFNTVVRDKSDLKGMSIPYLGAIPMIKKAGVLGRLKRDERPSEKIVVSGSGRDVMNESFRVVRTNLDFMTSSFKECRCIAVTSINPQSGKSYVSLNLAASLSLKNSRTLVVDGDFRRGTLSEAVDSPRIGLVNWLNSDVNDIYDVIVKGDRERLFDVLPMGIMPPNPTELILTDRFALAISELRDRYDYILIDCPPIDIVSDAAIIEQHCDSTIFIVRAGLMERDLLPELEALYKNKTYKNISLILNAVDYTNNRKYGYGKYGYGGYYSYGNKVKK